MFSKKKSSIAQVSKPEGLSLNFFISECFRALCFLVELLPVPNHAQKKVTNIASTDLSSFKSNHQLTIQFILLLENFIIRNHFKRSNKTFNLL